MKKKLTIRYPVSMYVLPDVRERMRKLNDKGIKNPEIVEAGVEYYEKKENR